MILHQLLRRMEKQSKENQILQEVPVEDIPYEVRAGVNPQTFNKQLIEPGNPMLRTPVAPYKDDLLKEFGIKDRKCHQCFNWRDFLWELFFII